MEDKRKQPIYSCASLNDPGLVRRFLSNHPKDALAKHEIGAVVGYLEGTLNGRYGAHFSATVLNDLAEDALIEIVTARQRFEGRLKLTTWMGTIALRASYRYFEGNFKLEGNFKKGGGGDNRESEAKADSHGDKYPLEDGENRSSEDHVANGTDKRGAYPITVSSDAPSWRETEGETGAPDAGIEDVDFLLLLDDAERQLTRKEARAFRAIMVQQGEYKQYAAREDMTVTAVRSLVADAKRKLRPILERQMGFSEAGFNEAGEDNGEKTARPVDGDGVVDETMVNETMVGETGRTGTGPQSPDRNKQPPARRKQQKDEIPKQRT